MEEHLRRRTTDKWHLYPTAGTEVSQFTLSQALTSLGQGGRRPLLVVQPDGFYCRALCQEASRNPITASHHVRRPYSYSDAVQRARILEENARAPPPYLNSQSMAPPPLPPDPASPLPPHSPISAFS